MVYEKESGVMRMILVSPLTHRSIVFENGCCHVFGDYTGYVIDSRTFSSVT